MGIPSNMTQHCEDIRKLIQNNLGKEIKDLYRKWLPRRKDQEKRPMKS